MINILIGAPGAGKSYEAVVFHVLPALSQGRKVITNLPLDLDRIASIDPTYLALIDIRTKTRATKPKDEGESAAAFYQRFHIPINRKPFQERAFSHIEDYGDPWRHPETGAGPLYVIDECHVPLPRGRTDIEVDEWFAEHRHETADVLLITQSYGKVSRSIIELVQVCYRVRKASAFGSETSYIRKVQDGVRGDVVNTAVRKYEKKYFGLYKSHTKGGGSELQAKDIVPLWKRWPFIGAAIMFPLAAFIFFAGGAPNPLSPTVKPTQTAQIQSSPAIHVEPLAERKETQEAPKTRESEPQTHPFSGRTLHILGTAVMRGKTIYHVTVAQNGQPISYVDSNELEALGYRVKAGSACAAQVGFGTWSNWIICDSPQVTLSAPGQGASPGPREQGAPPGALKVSM